MSNDYVTIDVLKSTLTLGGTTFADTDLTAVITAASRAVDNLCERRFYLDADATSVRYYTPTQRDILAIDDLIALGSVKTDRIGDGTFPDTWTVNVDFVLEPYNATADPADPRPYTDVRVHPNGSFIFPTGYPRSVKVTGQFGWSSVPDAVQAAAALLATRLLTIRRSAPLGIVAFDGVAVRIARADSTIMGLLGSYMRHSVAVA